MFETHVEFFSLCALSIGGFQSSKKSASRSAKLKKQGRPLKIKIRKLTETRPTKKGKIQIRKVKETRPP